MYDDETESDEGSDRGLSPMTFHTLRYGLLNCAANRPSTRFWAEDCTAKSGTATSSDQTLSLRSSLVSWHSSFDQVRTQSFQDREHDSPPLRVLATQAYIHNLSILAKLCKLLLPYLFREAVNPAVHYSRKTCLRAAQQVIRIELALEKRSCSLFLSNMTRHCEVLYIICFACIVLLLDQCLGSASGRHEAPSKETLEAYRVLKNASEYSPTAEKLFNSLVHLLSKHRVSLPANQATTDKEMDGLNSGENGRGSWDILRVPGTVNHGEVSLVDEVAQEQLLDGL